MQRHSFFPSLLLPPSSCPFCPLCSFSRCSLLFSRRSAVFYLHGLRRGSIRTRFLALSLPCSFCVSFCSSACRQTGLQSSFLQTGTSCSISWTLIFPRSVSSPTASAEAFRLLQAGFFSVPCPMLPLPPSFPDTTNVSSLPCRQERSDTISVCPPCKRAVLSAPF